MIELECTSGDSHEFLHLGSRLITGAANATDLPAEPQYGVWIARVDGFFGRSWLGFRGKLLGRVGVRNISLKSDLAKPPFPRKRVNPIRYFSRDPSGEWTRSERPMSLSLSVNTSKDNVNRNMWLKGLYVWYSSDSETNSKAAIMAYAIRKSGTAAWYTMWENQPPWKLVQHIGISPRTCRHFINLGTDPAAI